MSDLKHVSPKKEEGQFELDSSRGRASSAPSGDSPKSPIVSTTQPPSPAAATKTGNSPRTPTPTSRDSTASPDETIDKKETKKQELEDRLIIAAREQQQEIERKKKEAILQKISDALQKYQENYRKKLTNLKEELAQIGLAECLPACDIKITEAPIDYILSVLPKIPEETPKTEQHKIVLQEINFIIQDVFARKILGLFQDKGLTYADIKAYAPNTLSELIKNTYSPLVISSLKAIKHPRELLDFETLLENATVGKLSEISKIITAIEKIKTETLPHQQEEKAKLDAAAAEAKRKAELKEKEKAKVEAQAEEKRIQEEKARQQQELQAKQEAERAHKRDEEKAKLEVEVQKVKKELDNIKQKLGAWKDYLPTLKALKEALDTKPKRYQSYAKELGLSLIDQKDVQEYVVNRLRLSAGNILIERIGYLQSIAQGLSTPPSVQIQSIEKYANIAYKAAIYSHSFAEAESNLRSSRELPELDLTAINNNDVVNKIQENEYKVALDNWQKVTGRPELPDFLQEESVYNVLFRCEPPLISLGDLSVYAKHFGWQNLPRSSFNSDDSPELGSLYGSIGHTREMSGEYYAEEGLSPLISNNNPAAKYVIRYLICETLKQLTNIASKYPQIRIVKLLKSQQTLLESKQLDNPIRFLAKANKNSVLHPISSYEFVKSLRKHIQKYFAAVEEEIIVPHQQKEDESRKQKLELQQKAEAEAEAKRKALLESEEKKKQEAKKEEPLATPPISHSQIASAHSQSESSEPVQQAATALGLGPHHIPPAAINAAPPASQISPWRQWLKRYWGPLLIPVGIAAIALSPFTGGSSIFLGLGLLGWVFAGLGSLAVLAGSGRTVYQCRHNQEPQIAPAPPPAAQQPSPPSLQATANSINISVSNPSVAATPSAAAPQPTRQEHSPTPSHH